MTRSVGDLALRRRMPAVAASSLVVIALIILSFGLHVLHGGLWLGPTVAAVLLGFARWSGLSWSQLGLGRERLRSGLRWGFGAIGIVAVVYAVGVLLPLTRSAFLDTRYHLAVSGALRSALVIIPIGTILVEEIAFRSVLWGMLSRHATTWRVLLASSMLFGLWHVLPAMHLASGNQGVAEAAAGAGKATVVLVIAATVAFTALGGLVAGELRRRSGSILASAGMHWATNALGVLFGLLAWRLAG
jgi:membrane protease YdiL (CAAX protease family)